MLICSPEPFLTLSSALIGGGLAERKYLINMQVPHGYESMDPQADMLERLNEIGFPLPDTSAMMTAADVKQVVEGYMTGEQFRLAVFVTAGVGNAARAGKKRIRTYPGYTAGTINIIVIVDGKMTPAALVNAVVTITEAKAAALQDLGVVDAKVGGIATGTTTDSVIVASTQSEAYTGVHQYAGTATELGSAIGDNVYHALTVALDYMKPGRDWNEF